MATPVDMLERMEQLKREYDTLVVISVEDTAEEFGKLNTDQMYAGQLNDGTAIKPPYAASTVAIKKRKGQPYDRVTLRDTGAFNDAFRLQVIGQDLVEDSDVPYAPNLEKKYTEAIWGLNEANHEEYVDNYLAPDLQEKVSELTGLQHK
jgi:hypothetical protein